MTPSRRTKARSPNVPLHSSENGVNQAVMRYLSLDNRVAEFVRQNNGAMTAEYNGNKRFIRFVTDVHGKPVTVLDIRGTLIDGRAFEIECKLKLPKPITIERWKKTLPVELTDDANRFLAQEARIQFLRKHNAVAGFCTGAEDAKQLIDWAFVSSKVA